MKTTDFEHGTVPVADRRGWVSIAAVWIAIGIDLSGAFLGVELALGMEFVPALWATMVGSLLLGLMAMACGYVGAATGLSTANLSRMVFGQSGGTILAVALTISLVGWFSVQAGFFGSNAQIAFLEMTGADLPVAIFTITGGALMMLTALWGYRSISKLSSVAVPALLVLLLLGIILGFTQMGTAGLSLEVDPIYSFGGAVSLVMGIFILGVVTAPDMARWAKTPKAAMSAAFFGFFFGNSIIVVVSLVLARIVNETELVLIYFVLGLGAIAVVVLILAQWTTNTTNLYSAALNFAAINERLNRRTLTLAFGVVGIAVALMGAADNFISFISLMGSIVAPFGGVYLAVYLRERRSARFHPDTEIPTIQPYAVGAWVGGIFMSLLTTSPGDGLGFGLFDVSGIPTLDGAVFAFLLYFALMMTIGRKSTRSDSVQTRTSR